MSDADATHRKEALGRRRAPRATLAQVEAIGHEGDRFGRFFVLERLGAGGMGVVIAAYDPQLDRKVAIKVLRPDGVLARTELREQMIREAQAMARLSHPNVVAIHEVGTVERVFFIVMELVEGTTLKTWMASPRDWREVVRVLCAAGRGLAAAHAHGLVHRDFKPHNVLVGADGRVRVTDFGVVGVAGAVDASTVVGTPAYMAPEQHAPGVVDVRVDQHAFCATLYEALYGGLPSDLAPTSRDDVPAGIHAAIMRGLSADPAARFPSMDALLAELERDRRRVVRPIVLGVLLVVLATLAVIGWTRPSPSDAVVVAPVDPCDPSRPQTLAGAWNPERGAAITAAFQATRPPLAAETSQRVGARLDRYAERWTKARTRACAARSHDVPVACLDRQREAVDALTRVLARPDAAIVPNAVAAVSNLDPPEDCRSLAPIAGIARVPHRSDELSRARALHAAGLPREAADLAQQILDANDPQLAPHAALVLGRARRDLGEGEAAATALLRAITDGATLAFDEVVARAYADLAWVTSYFLGKPKEALAMRPFVTAAIARAGSPAQVRAFAEFAAGSALVELGRYDEAMVPLEAARAAWRDALDREHPEAARVLLTIGNVLGYRGDRAGAEAAYREVLAMREVSLGVNHPSLAGVLANLGGKLLENGRASEAVLTCERARSIAPAEPSARAHLDRCIGRAQLVLDQLAEAEVALQRAAEGAKSIPNGWVGYVLADLGELALRRGDVAGALATCERALAALSDSSDETGDEAHPDRAYGHLCRGRARLEGGDVVGARADLERALALGGVTGVPSSRGELRFALARAGGDPALAALAIVDFTEAGLASRAAAVTAWREAQ